MSLAKRRRRWPLAGPLAFMATFVSAIFVAATLLPIFPGIGLTAAGYGYPTPPPTRTPPPTTTAPPQQGGGGGGGGSLPQCSDFLDNDGDGRTDWNGNGNPANADPDCDGPNDDSEAGATTPPPASPATTAPPQTSSPSTPPGTQPPTTQPPGTQPPDTQPPDTQPPETPPASESPEPSPSPTATEPVKDVLIDTRTTIDFRPRRSEFWGRVRARFDADGENSTDRGAATGFSFGTVDLAFARRAAAQEEQPEPSPEMCETGRRVLLKKKRPGADRVVGRDRVNKRDRWSEKVSRHAKGRFYAVLPEKTVIAEDGTIVTCERTRSRGAKPSK